MALRNDEEQRARLAWLLVFRVAAATVLLLLTLAADITASTLSLMSPLLYGVAIGTYVVVLVLALLLKGQTPPAVVSGVHLATSVLAALMVVHGSGGVDSTMSFLYLLAVLDGAIIGGRTIAFAMASAASLAYGGQLVAELHGLLPAAAPTPPPSVFVRAAGGHIAAFFLTALLAGYLAELVGRARATASAAQTHLERFRHVQQVVASALPVGVLTANDQGMIVSVNQRGAEILGGTVDGLSGAPCPAKLTALAPRPDGVEDVTLPTAAGSRVLSVSHATAELPSDDGSPAPIRVFVLEDRTELRALEHRLHEGARLAALGQLAAAIAHEIRNPLAAISGSVELLTTDPGDEVTLGRLRDIILREIGRLDRMVGDFLIYARPIEPRRSVVNIAQLVDELTARLRNDASWDGQPIVVTCPPELQGFFDRDHVRHLLWNLLRNAIEASLSDMAVEVEVRTLGHDLAFEIRDEGPGIGQAARGDLFEPFKTTKQDRPGLGLAVARRVVDAHGGTISFEARAGRGTAVRVTFPQAAALHGRSPGTLPPSTDPVVDKKAPPIDRDVERTA